MENKTLFDDKAAPRITGHVLIRDPDSGHVILDKKNAVHYENLSLAIALALAGNNEGLIYEMAFGNGGAVGDPTGALTYFPTNTKDPNANLYNPTYSKVINRNTPTPSTGNNFIEVKHLSGTLYTDIIITCTLEYDEPSDQSAFDMGMDDSDPYIFNELGLKKYSPDGNGKLLTHIVFNPIRKALNRRIEVIYTLRIQMA